MKIATLKPTVWLLLALLTAPVLSALASSDDKAYNLKLEGTVSQFNTSTKTFVLGGYTIRVNAQTRYEYSDSQPMSSNLFWSTNRNGSRVEVKANRSGNLVTAVKIELKSRR
ncbi:MAG: hypothetical protein KatS3mg074_529 [Meiothermus sp.]|uniref:DUF5666 domain-containing protein n=2 Tax=Meiothermus hypogaeus TaxID=884155 RepID=A0A511R4N8_9DEIN|nr:DUF5666 domain-containing protein [Meiothermus hypogaeus]RIH77811.1 hypothetical protein Mhypo_01841 [Meiothermus hypogaeus]GEM83986.1 hypothetical protein MHY01S_21520 [Meiothermus hypogaeus NBRC 106114]GIW38131.1 MAG: hypothetical protein KatS3mg074_529 [Meiothermus sp.]